MILVQMKNISKKGYNQEFTLYVFNQHNLTNEQYSDIFDTNVDVGDAILIPCPNERHSTRNSKNV